AGGPGATGNPQTDPALLAGAVRDVPAARPGRLDGPRLRRRGRRARRLVRVARAPPVAWDLAGRVDAPVPLLDRLPRPALRRRRGRRAGRLTPGSRISADAGPAVRPSPPPAQGGPDDRVPGRSVRRRRGGLVPGDVAVDSVPRQRRGERRFLGGPARRDPDDVLRRRDRRPQPLPLGRLSRSPYRYACLRSQRIANP